MLRFVPVTTLCLRLAHGFASYRSPCPLCPPAAAAANADLCVFCVKAGVYPPWRAFAFAFAFAFDFDFAFDFIRVNPCASVDKSFGFAFAFASQFLPEFLQC